MGDVRWKVGDTPEIYFMQAIECVCVCVSHLGSSLFWSRWCTQNLRAGLKTYISG